MKSGKSAGIVLYKINNAMLHIFLVHPGGPYWKKKDNGAWSIPKGEFTDGESPLEAAKREFKEETGFEIEGDFIKLEPIKQKAGKLVYAWAVEGDIDAGSIKSNLFKMEWPPKSGKWESFSEVDKGAWFTSAEAKIKINESQKLFLLKLEEKYF